MKLDQAARLPDSSDNCAIAVQRLEAGTEIDLLGKTIRLGHTVLEGHRLAVGTIAAGETLTSWGLPFGRALRRIEAGEYVCNATMQTALRSRHVNFAIPDAPNFEDYFQPYQLDEASFRPAEQLPLHATLRTFEGFARPGGRGAGTRNHVVVLGTSSLTGSFARLVAAAFRDAPEKFPNVSGVVAIAHTEGGESTSPNNLQLTLRTLAGFVTNPNVGAVLALDYGSEPVNNDALAAWMRANGSPLDAVPHRFLRLGNVHETNLAQARAAVNELLTVANQTPRTTQPVRHLKIGLQCGGSDAFSGVSGNPLVGIIAREAVRHGGAANLAETDELMGAEAYVLAKVRDRSTARKFLQTLATFEERLSWHGVSGQTNPSGGNIYRGLYNIAIKSIGAARKKDPQLRLDWVIDYGEPMLEPGFYFMNSPGNDLESIAGQVAAGCNLILFSTGNGSITNHPFVPTIKVMTNTGRFNLLNRDMDFNAGRYLDGEPLEQLGEAAFNYAIEVASGRKSVGEKAGHSQAQLWREWRQTAKTAIQQKATREKPLGKPLSLRSIDSAPTLPVALMQPIAASNRIRLIIPTSLCAGQIARLIADKLNATHTGVGPRYVALPHTEGCGVSGEAIDILEQVIAGYAAHPLAERVLLLEHGCEKTHNDAIRNFLTAHGIDHSAMGFASIQLDGGIERVTDKVMKWFESTPASTASSGIGKLRLGIVSAQSIPAETAAALARVTSAVVSAGGSVLVPQSANFLRSADFTELLLAEPVRPTLAYGGILQQSGLHIMAMPGTHVVEALTGLGSCGANLILMLTGDLPVQAHPFVPTVQASIAAGVSNTDVALSGLDVHGQTNALLAALAESWSGVLRGRSQRAGNVDFQVSRGWFGVST